MAGKKRNKTYRPRWNGDGVKLRAQPLKVKLVFDPLYAILDQLEQHGTVDVTANGMPIFRDTGDGNWYDTVAALNGVVQAYEIHERRQNRPLHLEPLKQLSNKLHYGMPIFEEDAHACRDCLARMRAETLEMTSAYATELINDFRIAQLMPEC